MLRKATVEDDTAFRIPTRGGYIVVKSLDSLIVPVVATTVAGTTSCLLPRIAPCPSHRPS